MHERNVPLELRLQDGYEDACWFSWSELKRLVAKLVDYRFEWVLAGHGGSVRLPVAEMRRRLRSLVERT